MVRITLIITTLTVREKLGSRLLRNKEIVRWPNCLLSAAPLCRLKFGHAFVLFLFFCFVFRCIFAKFAVGVHLNGEMRISFSRRRIFFVKTAHDHTSFNGDNIDVSFVGVPSRCVFCSKESHQFPYHSRVKGKKRGKCSMPQKNTPWLFFFFDRESNYLILIWKAKMAPSNAQKRKPDAPLFSKYHAIPQLNTSWLNNWWTLILNREQSTAERFVSEPFNLNQRRARQQRKKRFETWKRTSTPLILIRYPFFNGQHCTRRDCLPRRKLQWMTLLAAQYREQRTQQSAVGADVYLWNRQTFPFSQ